MHIMGKDMKKVKMKEQKKLIPFKSKCKWGSLPSKSLHRQDYFALFMSSVRLKTEFSSNILAYLFIYNFLFLMFPKNKNKKILIFKLHMFMYNYTLIYF